MGNMIRELTTTELLTGILIGDRSSRDKEVRAADNFDPGWANKAQLISFIDTGLRNSIRAAIELHFSLYHSKVVNIDAGFQLKISCFGSQAT